MPNDQQPLFDRLLKMPQKPGGEETVDRWFPRLKSAAPIRCDSTEREWVFLRRSFRKDRCLPAWRPRRGDCWEWTEAQFIEKNNRALFTDFFFQDFQPVLGHAAMAASSLCRARRTRKSRVALNG